MSKKEVLFVNEIQLAKDKKTINNALEIVSKVIEISEDILQEKLTGVQKLEVIKDGRNFVQNELRKKYQFKNADDDFNLQAMGVNPEPLYRFLSSNVTKLKNIHFEVKKNEVVLSKVQPLIERNIFYLTTDKQKDALDVAQKLVDVLNEADEKGLVFHNFPKIKEVIKIVSNTGRFDEKPLFSVNKEYIARMK